MLSSILILFALPLLDTSRLRSCAFRPLARLVFWAFVVHFFLLLWLGGQHPEPPYVQLGQFCPLFYFSYFLVLVAGLGVVENTLFDIATLPNTPAGGLTQRVGRPQPVSTATRKTDTAKRVV